MEWRNGNEKLQSEDLSDGEVRTNLRVLDRLHWLLGTYRPLLRSIRSRTTTDPVRLLDVGAGSGYLANYLGKHLDRTVRYVRVETDLQILRVTGSEEMNVSVMGRAPGLPFPGNSFDVVTSSLVLHHLDPGQHSQFLRETFDMARSLVVHHDLVRSRLAYWISRLGLKLLTTDSIARHDGTVSVLRSRTVKEWRRLLAENNLGYELDRSFPLRINLIATP